MEPTKGSRELHAKDSDNEPDQLRTVATGQTQRQQLHQQAEASLGDSTTATAAPRGAVAPAGSVAWLGSGRVPASGRLGLVLANGVEQCCTWTFLTKLILMNLVLHMVQSLLLSEWPQAATAAHAAIVTFEMIMLQLAIITQVFPWVAEFKSLRMRLDAQLPYASVAALLAGTRLQSGGALQAGRAAIRLLNAQRSFLLTCSGRYVLQRVFGGYNVLMWLVWSMLLVVFSAVPAMPIFTTAVLYAMYLGSAVLVDLANTEASKARLSDLHLWISAELGVCSCAVEPHIVFDSLDYMERLVLGVASRVSSIPSPAGCTAAWLSLCCRALQAAAAAAGSRLVISTSSAMGIWLLGWLRSTIVSATLGFLQILTTPLQFWGVSRWLYASGTISVGPFEVFWTFPVVLLQLVLLPGSPAFKIDYAILSQKGQGYSWLLISFNYLVCWIVNAVDHLLCSYHTSACSYAARSLSSMMSSTHVIFACFWVIMQVGPAVFEHGQVSVDFQCFVAWLYWGRWATPCSLPTHTKLAWTAMLPVCVCLGPLFVACCYFASFNATPAACSAQVPLVFHSVCSALQGSGSGSPVAASFVSALAVLVVCVLEYSRRIAVHLYVHRTPLLLHMAGCKVQLRRCRQYALPWLSMQLSGVKALLQSSFASVKAGVIRLSVWWHVPRACSEGNTSTYTPAENSRGGDVSQHTQGATVHVEALKAEAQESMRECIICQDAARSVALKPCGHLACCEGCFARLQRDAARCSSARRSGPGRLKCPVCRAEVQGHVAGIIM